MQERDDGQDRDDENQDKGRADRDRRLKQQRHQRGELAGYTDDRRQEQEPEQQHEQVHPVARVAGSGGGQRPSGVNSLKVAECDCYALLGY
jgi:hypothetical protein